jgi:hypothetical protein
MIAKIITFVKQYPHGLFIGFSLLLVAGIGYNIGQVWRSNHPLINVEAQISNPANKGAILQMASVTATPEDPRVVASKNSKSKLYHHLWCSGAQRIKETNKVWFPTEEAAISAGYTLAANCH